MAKMSMRKILRKVLENVGIPESYYSIEGYKAGATCIEKVDKVYVVYNAKRDEKCKYRQYESELEACTDVIRRIAKNNKDFRILKQEFYDTRAKEVLKKIFENEGIPRQYYSLEGYAEEAVCMEKSDDSYIVYIGEKGKKHDVNDYLNISEALLNVISDVTESYAQEEKVMEAFIDKLYKTV